MTALAAATAMTVAACGKPDTSAAASNEPALGAPPIVDSYDDLVFPLDSYHFIDAGDENFIICLEGMAGKLAADDSRLEAAFATWSDCIADAGFAYRDPWQANNDPAFAEETASPREIATATADVACRDENNVNGIWVAVRSAKNIVATHQ